MAGWIKNKTQTPSMPSTLAGGIPNYLAPLAELGSWSRDVVGQMAGAYGNVGAAAEQAKGNIGAAQATAKGTSEAGRFGALGGLAQAMAQDNANRYGAYSTAEASRQNAMANEAQGRYSSYGIAEAARQTALGNLGSAALGAYGSNANQALQAWSQNQQAYNNALAQMQGSSQSAMSGLGQSRNAALAGLGGAYAASDIGANIGTSGGGFNAVDPTGTVASGSYSPSGGSSGGSTAGLDSVSQNLMAGDISSALQDNANRGLDSLNAQHYTSRMMPSQMQAQTFGDLLTMGSQYIAPTMAGMNEFYANSNANRPDFSAGMNQFYGAMESFQPDYSGVLNALTRGGAASGSYPLPEYSTPAYSAQPVSAPARSLPVNPLPRAPRVSEQEKQDLVRSMTGQAYPLGSSILDQFYNRLA